LAVYIDSVLDSTHNSSATAVLTNAAEFVVGRSQCAGEHTAPFTGDLDEVTLFNRVLSVEEIRGLNQHGVLANDTNTLGDLMMVALVKSTAHGSLALNADGTFSYIPVPGFTGQDRFTYRATNTAGEPSADATVTIDVRPQSRSSSGSSRR
jgi:hypothetical protein